MTSLVAVLLVGALVVSALDWFAVAQGHRFLEYVCKPTAATLFVAAAMALDVSNSSARMWLVIALVLSVVGDVFLMLPRDAFVQGLAAFAVAQVGFTISFALRSPTAWRFVLSLFAIGFVAILLARRFITAIAERNLKDLVPAVVVYMVVISAMVVAASSAGNAIGIAGAILFLVSDSLIAEQRFVAARPWQPLTIIVTYHLALAGLVLSMA